MITLDFVDISFFESEDPKLLPWNTTKTGVDTNAITYRAVRNDMILLMKPVITFLKEYRKEKSNEELDDKPLEIALQTSQLVALETVKTAQVFTYPPPQRPKRSKSTTGIIQYRKPLEQIKRVQKELGVTTNKEVGLKTFDYFWRKECSEE